MMHGAVPRTENARARLDPEAMQDDDQIAGNPTVFGGTSAGSPEAHR
jgi:hypothetical protein